MSTNTPSTSAPFENGQVFNFKINQYLTELSTDDTFINTILNNSCVLDGTTRKVVRFIHGMPGLGKTTFIHSLPGCKILAVPTRALVDQQTDPSNNIFAFMGGVSTEQLLQQIDQLPRDTLLTIVTTYDSAPIIVDALSGRMRKPTLIIDECHCLFSESKYRGQALDKMFNLMLHKGAICLSGTNFQPLIEQIFNNLLATDDGVPAGYTICNVSKYNQQPLDIQCYFKEEGNTNECDIMAGIIDSVWEVSERTDTFKRVLIFHNNKDALKQMKQKCVDQRIPALLYTSENQHEHTQQQFIKTGLCDQYQVILCTSALIQGVSIYTHIDYAVAIDVNNWAGHNYNTISPDTLVQFIFRMRNNVPSQVRWYRNSIHEFDESQLINDDIDINKHVSVKHHMSRIVSRQFIRNPVHKDATTQYGRATVCYERLFNFVCHNFNAAKDIINDFGCTLTHTQWRMIFPQTSYRKKKITWQYVIDNLTEIFDERTDDLNTDSSKVRLADTSIAILKKTYFSKGIQVTSTSQPRFFDKVCRLFQQGPTAVTIEVMNTTGVFDLLCQKVTLDLKTEYTRQAIEQHFEQSYDDMCIAVATTINKMEHTWRYGDAHSAFFEQLVDSEQQYVDEQYIKDTFFKRMSFADIKRILKLKKIFDGKLLDDAQMPDRGNMSDEVYTNVCKKYRQQNSVYRFLGFTAKNINSDFNSDNSFIDNTFRTSLMLTHFDNIHDVNTASVVSLDDILNQIKNQRVEKASTYRDMLDNKSDIVQLQSTKQQLPGVIFNVRTNKPLTDLRWGNDIVYTGIVVLDVNIDPIIGKRRTRQLNNIEKTVARLKQHENVLFLFRSPSGGLKIGVKTNFRNRYDNGADQIMSFNLCWQYVCRRFSPLINEFDLSINEACNDHMHITFLSNDSELHVRSKLHLKDLDVEGCIPDFASPDQQYFDILNSHLTQIHDAVTQRLHDKKIKVDGGANVFDSNEYRAIVGGLKALLITSPTIITSLESCSDHTHPPFFSIATPTKTVTESDTTERELAVKVMLKTFKAHDVELPQRPFRQPKITFPGMDPTKTKSIKEQLRIQQRKYPNMSQQEILNMPVFDKYRVLSDMPLQITFYNGANNSVSERNRNTNEPYTFTRTSFKQLPQVLKRFVVARKNEAKGINCCHLDPHGSLGRKQIFKDGTATGEYEYIPNTIARCKANIVQIDALILDYDGGMTIEQFEKDHSHYNYFLYTSFGHQLTTAEKPIAIDKFRVIIPLTTPCTDIADFDACKEGLLAHFPNIDSSAFDVSRMFYGPSSPPTNQHKFYSKLHTGGLWFDLSTIKRTVKTVHVPKSKSKLNTYKIDDVKAKQVYDALLGCNNIRRGTGRDSLASVCNTFGLTFTDYSYIISMVAGSDSSLNDPNQQTALWASSTGYNLTWENVAAFIERNGGTAPAFLTAKKNSNRQG